MSTGEAGPDTPDLPSGERISKAVFYCFTTQIYIIDTLKKIVITNFNFKLTSQKCHIPFQRLPVVINIHRQNNVALTIVISEVFLWMFLSRWLCGAELQHVERAKLKSFQSSVITNTHACMRIFFTREFVSIDEESNELNNPETTRRLDPPSVLPVFRRLWSSLWCRLANLNSSIHTAVKHFK